MLDNIILGEEMNKQHSNGNDCENDKNNVDEVNEQKMQKKNSK